MIPSPESPKAPALIPCPFCESEATATSVGERYIDELIRPSYFVECVTCGTMGPDHDAPEAARDAWNRRPAPTPAAPEPPVPALPEWFSKPHRHPDYCDPCYEDLEAVIKWNLTHVELLEKLVKELAAPKPAPEPPVPVDLDAMAEAVHVAYLDTCKSLGWDVKPANQVPYADLTEDSKELDRASVRAVISFGIAESDALGKLEKIVTECARKGPGHAWPVSAMYDLIALAALRSRLSEAAKPSQDPKPSLTDPQPQHHGEAK